MAADELRGLYLDIEVRGVEDATKDIEVASQATDSLAEDFQDLVTNSELVSKAIGHTEEKVESLGDSLSKTAGSAIALKAALSSLGDTQLGDVGDVDLYNTTLPDGERTIQQTLQRDVETNQSVSQPDIDKSEFVEGAAASHLYSEGLDDAQQSAIESSIASRVAASSADEAGDSFQGSTLEALLFGQSLSKIRNEAYSTVPALTATQSQIDEIGDESTSSTAQVLALRSALQGLGGSSSSVDFGPFNVGLGTAILAVGTLIPLILSLGAAFGGLLTAGLGLAGVIGGALAGGFLALSEQVGGTETLLTEFKTAAKEALSPLQQPIFADFALDVMRGAVKLLNQFATFAAITFRQVKPLVDLVSGAFWDNSPEFFAALNYSITELAPILADMMTYLARGIPDAIVYLTDVAKDLAPTLANLWHSVQPLVKELIDLGVTIFTTLGPALSLLINGLTLAVSAFNSLPDFAQSGIILAATAIFTLVGAISLLGSAISGIIGIVGTFFTILEVGGLIYSLVGGVLSLSTVLGGLSTVLYGAAGAVTTFLSAIGPVGWAIMAIGAGIAAYQTNLFGFKDAVDSVIGSLIEFGSGIVNAVLNPMDTLEGITNALLNPLDTLGGIFEWISNLSLGDIGALTILAPPIGAMVAGAKAAQSFLEKLGGLEGVMSGLQGTINTILNPIQSLKDGLQSLSNIDVVDVSVNLIKRGAEDLWNWLTPDIGGFQQDMQKLGEKINKQSQNLSPEEKKQAQLVWEVAACHRTVGMVFDYWSRGLLSPLLDDDDIGCFLDTVSRGAAEVCEEFYDTLK